MALHPLFRYPAFMCPNDFNIMKEGKTAAIPYK